MGGSEPASSGATDARGADASPADPPMAITVRLVRHGETDWNRDGRLQGREDVELSARGREQARLTAVFLAGEAWDLVVSSPLARASETARIIADYLGIAEVVHMEEFAERDYGVTAGLTPREREERYPWDVWPGLEPRESVSARCRVGLRALVEPYPGSRIVVVSHGAAINAMLATLSGGAIGSGRTTLGNACISTLRFRDQRWRIESYNSVSHLGLPSEGGAG